MIPLPRGLAVDISGEMLSSLEDFAVALREMNRRINLVSRDDEDRIASRHIPHCLTLAIRPFKSGLTIVDWGTGGGLPLIPLAILFPDVRFVGVDAVAKKVRAVNAMIRRLGLENAAAVHTRAEQFTGSADISVSRATAPLAGLWSWHRRIAGEGRPDAGSAWSDGLVCLKGGDLDEEIAKLRDRDPGVAVERIPIAPMIADPYFREKEIISITTERSDG